MKNFKVQVKKVKVIILILAIGIASPAFSQSNIDSTRIVKVLSFNILHGATTNGDFDLDAIAKVILDVDPDFVSLQEVDFKTKRAKNYDLATEMGWRTKMASLFGKAMDFDGGGYGEGVLSRWSITSSRNVPLPFGEGKEPRAALEITVAIPSGDTISFIGTHLDHTRDNSSRIMQAKEINKAFASNPYPSILTGDLNDVPGSVPMNILEEIWEPSYDRENPSPTIPSTGPKKKIDYIMFKEKARWEVLETKVICDPIASDHCAYYAVLLLKD